MLVPVFVECDNKQVFRVLAPNFPGCNAQGSELGRTITRIHLKLEGRVSEMLINGESLPAEDELDMVCERGDESEGDLYRIHINLVHLAGVGRHQTRVRVPQGKS